MKNKSFAISKVTLDNGFTLLICPLHTIPKVAVQIWYGVGSKNEKVGQKGIAHFIEHMIFKGTEKLAEPDIGLVASRLSGSCNAFTSQDYTGYLFDFPTQHWQEALPILSDCMRNCTFKQELFDSELKAVIQELKMYKDDYEDTLTEQMMTAIFAGHPYHHPIIGYKRDLWNLRRDALLSFYNKHYVPNNATLVVVGNIDIASVIKDVGREFGGLSKSEDYSPQQFYPPADTVSKAVSIYRDVQQPLIQFSFFIPGLSEGSRHLADCVAWLLCNGRDSRLHKKLVDELQIAIDVEAFVEDLFDRGLFFIKIRPAGSGVLEQIEQEVCQEIALMQQGDFHPIELQRAKKKAQVDFLSLSEDYEELAYEIGKNFLATGAPDSFSVYLNDLEDKRLGKQLKDFVAAFF
ncbi:M16 family metallopeptidase [Candidatus Dependentiae bacterium]